MSFMETPPGTSIPSGPKLEEATDSAQVLRSDSLTERFRLIRWRRMRNILLAIVVIAHVPYVVEYTSALVMHPGSYYLLLLPIGLWVLGRNRLHREPAWMPNPLLYSSVLLAGCATLVVATYLNSAWLGAVAALVSALGCTALVGGRSLVAAWVPAWALCWTLVVPPIDLADRLLADLQAATVSWTSLVLDEVDVLHLVDGETIEVSGNSVSVADMYGGMQSVLLMASLAFFWGLWRRRSAWHVFLLIAAAIGVAIVTSITQIGVIVIAPFEGVDFAIAWPHVALVCALFTIGLVLVGSADQLLLSMLRLFGAFVRPHYSLVAQRLRAARRRLRWRHRRMPNETRAMPPSAGFVVVLITAFVLVGGAEMFLMASRLFERF